MSKIHEVMVSAILPVIKKVGKIEMQQVLFNIKESNSPEIYKTTLQGLYSNFKLLKEVATKTKSHLDDGIIELVLEAVQENAGLEGFVLD
jgi:hypothetical protein